MAALTETAEKIWQEVWDWMVWHVFRPSYQCEAELPSKDCVGCACCVRHMGHWGRHRTNDGRLFTDGH